MTDPTPILPYDQDAYDPAAPQKPRPLTLGDTPFGYIGQPLNIAQFQTYVQGYDFGPVLPDFVVLHHTANPAASWAPLANAPNWDRAESALPDDLIRTKRKAQLDGLMHYYRDTLGWSCGPHLFIDDRYIWLFSPMSEVGIHAKWGNSFHAGGTLHYSIGIEVVGYFGSVPWPTNVARNVRGAILALRDRLHTFDLHYLYADSASKPGMIGLDEHQQCAHPDRLRWGGISSHRDYNKPACPGSAISEAFYLAVLTAQDTPPVPPSPHLPPSASYRVKAAVSAGATVRSDARRSSLAVDHLAAGAAWHGVEVVGEAVRDPIFGQSDIWICDGGRYVWAGLLEKVL